MLILLPTDMRAETCSCSAHIHSHRLKCNRALPCDTCIKRAKSSLCSYATNANRSKPGPSKGRELKDRLNTLENLVSSFLSGDAVIHPGLPIENEPTAGHRSIIASPSNQFNGSTEQSSTFDGSSGEDALTPETPHLQETGSGQVNYIDPSHWLSILDDIKEVQEHLSSSDQPISRNETAFDTDGAISDASFLFPADHNPTLGEIVQSLPSQPICDMLLSWYFNSQFMVLGKKTDGRKKLL